MRKSAIYKRSKGASMNDDRIAADDRRREARYQLISEIVSSKKMRAETYSELAYGSNWDDR